MDHTKPWTCQELVDHAENWSLAGNVGLLMHMEQFAENMFNQAYQTSNNLENLLEDLNSTDIQLDIVRNQFLGLQNTQFIESRVYEDDETVVSEPSIEATEQKLDDTAKHELIKSAVTKGLEVLDKYYDNISIPESDSDLDEPDYRSYMLREKDPYIHRPLPYIIGTEEWHTKWHAGLGDSSDEDDDNELRNGGKAGIEEEFSDTDSESNLPVVDRRFDAYKNQVDNYNNTAIEDENSDEFNGNSIPVPITNATFAEQLAAKLGDVLIAPDLEVNNRPIKRKPTTSLLPDVPPILQESDDDKRAEAGMFSGGGGLFDSYEANKPPPITAPIQNQIKVPNLFDDDEDEDFIPQPVSTQQLARNETTRGLFDDTDSEDDFSVPVPTKNISNGQGATSTERKPPAGGVNVLGGFLPKRKSSSSEEEDISDQKQTSEAIPSPLSQPPPIKVEEKKKEKKVLSLFDDTDDIFEDDIFVSSPDIMSKKPSKSKLFDDSSETTKINKNLFGEASENVNLFDDDNDITRNMPPLFSTDTQEKTKKKTRNLFDESDEEDDEFSSLPVSEKPGKNFFEENENNSLFVDDKFKENIWAFADETPPVLPSTNKDESEILDENSIKNKGEIESKEEADKSANTGFTIFDKHPPPLLENIPVESTQSAIRKLPGKIKHNLNINVAALMPGARVIKDDSKPEQEFKQTNQESPKDDNSASHIDKENIIEQQSSSNSEVLNCMTKTRAKIPMKRKPSTRQARRKALETCQSLESSSQALPEEKPIEEFKNNDMKDDNNHKEEKVEQTEENKLKTANLFDDLITDINDISDTKSTAKGLFDDLEDSFKIKDTQSSMYNQSSSSTPRKQLIVDDDDKPEDIPAPSLQKTTTKSEDRKKISLFDDLDDVEQNDYLFTSDLLPSKKTDVGNVRVFGETVPIVKDMEKDKRETLKIGKGKSLVSGLFDNIHDDEEDDLFATASRNTNISFPKKQSEDLNIPTASINQTNITSQPITKTKKSNNNKSLFDDCEDDDDLFATSFKPKTSKTFQASKVKVNKIQSQSIFGDDDDSDDIFNTKKIVKPTTLQEISSTSQREREQHVTNKIVPVSITKPKNDPLAALFDDDGD